MRFKILCAILFALPAYGQIFTVSGSDPRLATFANLGTPTDGKWRYCTDCAATAPCTGSDTGAFAYRVGSAWNCNTGGTSLPVTDTQTIVKGSSDATKLLRFEVDGFTTGTTVVLTPPPLNGTIVTLNAVQTIINKELDFAALESPSINSTIYTFGTTPTVSNTTANSCGTTAATITGNDMTGVITVGATAGTNCTITFSASASAPITRRQCTVTNETSANLSRSTFLTITTSTVEGTFAAGDKISYICMVY